MLYIFGIKTTGNCGSTNKQANEKNNILPSKMATHENFSKSTKILGLLKKKKLKNCESLKKKPRNKKS